MFTPQILRFKSLPSTNLEAAKLASGNAPEGLCVVAREQSAGRGRLERQWVSPEGAGLYFSIILRPEFDQRIWPLLTLMSAIAVHDVLKNVCGLVTDIKWPNDVLVNEKKLCGILAETVHTQQSRAVVLGIGINMRHNAFPPELAAVATSVEDAGGKDADPETLIEPLVGSLANYYQTLHDTAGPETVIREWSSRSSYGSGKRIRVVNADETLQGTSCGLESDGALRIRLESGDIKIVRTGDVTSVRPAD